MGVYENYLNQKLNFQDLVKEMEKQLLEISAARGNNDIIVFASCISKNKAPISIGYNDLLPFKDQLDNLSGNSVDLILETPGGAGEIAEDIIDLLHKKYPKVGVIVPGCAKSAGTIMAMGAHEILMGPCSALGPIDAQLFWQGKSFSAQALIEGVEKIKDEVTKTGNLNRAYIPILQGISPGELQNAQNALDFAKITVTKWLEKFKFQDWEKHTSDGRAVTQEDKKKRAKEIAEELCDHGKWLSHAKSIKIQDLQKMRLRIIDYSLDEKLNDAITRYYTLLQILFMTTGIYKVYQTQKSKIYQFMISQTSPKKRTEIPIAEIECPNCGTESKLQINLGKEQPIKSGLLPFPKDNLFKCPNCNQEIDLTDFRRQFESQSKMPIIV